MKPGAEIIAGDVLDVAVGASLVLKASNTHGGRECLVCAPGGGSARWLWFWPRQTVRVLRHDPLTLGRVLQARAEAAAKFKDLRTRATP